MLPNVPLFCGFFVVSPWSQGNSTILVESSLLLQGVSRILLSPYKPSSKASRMLPDSDPEVLIILPKKDKRALKF